MPCMCKKCKINVAIECGEKYCLGCLKEELYKTGKKDDRNENKQARNNR